MMKKERTSRLPGFYKLSPQERLKEVAEFAGLSAEELDILRRGVPLEDLNRMVENVVAKFELPLGIATNFLINGRDYLVPMVTEEPSVIAAACNAARIAREAGGFVATSTEPIMIGQIQLCCDEPEEAKQRLLDAKEELLGIANSRDETLVRLGGGAKDLEARLLPTGLGKMLILHLLVDTRDAMGANIVNRMCEAVGKRVEELSRGKVLLRIVSNLAVKRLARAEVRIQKGVLSEEEMLGIVSAYEFAASDPYRAVTHNKGVMNGIIAVALATGNDTRAIEAGAHGYAALGGRYKPLTTWEMEDKCLVGRIELPLAVGIVGGATVHPLARTCLKILGVKSAKELAEVMAAVGLAQNFAALRALVTEGITKGHMRLHARNLAAMAGAKGEEIDEVASRMVSEGEISFSRAKQLLEGLRSRGG